MLTGAPAPARWLLWVGKPLGVANLIFGANHRRVSRLRLTRTARNFALQGGALLALLLTPSGRCARVHAPSLAHQSEAAGFTPGLAEDSRRNHAVNVHGCGIGWYGTRPGSGLLDATGLTSYERPAVYTTTSAPTHDRNLRSLAKMLEASLLFGHVRAAGPGASVHQFNCHPFQAGRFLFMHNGEVAGASLACPAAPVKRLTPASPCSPAHPGYKRIRRSLQARLKDCWFDWLSGTTDSELLFALFLNNLPDCVSQYSPSVLADALRAVIALVVEATDGEPSSLNIAVTDGETVLATRFRNGPGQVPPSLYYHSGGLSCESWDLAEPSWNGLTHGLTQDGLMVNPGAQHAGGDEAASVSSLSSSFDGTLHSFPRRCSSDSLRIASAKRELHPRQSLLVSSEPLTEDNQHCEWQVFPANTLLVASPIWRGGERDGQPATRHDLTESPLAEDSGVECVVLNVQWCSLKDLAQRGPRATDACTVPRPPLPVAQAPAESIVPRVSALTMAL